MQQPNKAVISEDLEGLMLVMQGMSKLQKKGGGAPAMGGPPSIADQAKQAGAQALAPQQQMQQQPGMTPPPQGQQAPEGGIAGIAQNAATGMGIQQMQDQKAQEAVMQMAKQQQQQQQPTQMMASGGIAGLPAENMRGFAEGGVLGFSGEESSEVPSLAERVKQQAVREALLRQKREQQPQPEVTLEGAFNAMRRLRGLGASAPTTAAPEEKPSAAQSVSAGPLFQYRPDNASQMLSELMAQSKVITDPAEQAAVAAQISKMMQAGVTPRPTAPNAAMPAPAGTQYAEQRPERVAGNTQPYTPTVAPLDSGIASIAGQFKREFPSQTGEYEARMKAHEKLLAERPLVGTGNIAALTKAQQQEEALNKQLEDSALSRQLSAFLSGMQNRTEGATMDKFHAGEDARKRAQIALALNREQSIAAQQELQQAQRIGDSAGMLDATSKLTKLKEERNQHLMQATSSAYGASERAESARAAAGTAANRQDLARYLEEVKTRELDKRYDTINALEAIANTPDAKKKLVKLKAEASAIRDEILRKYPSLTKNDIPTSHGGGSAVSPAQIDTSGWNNFKSGTSK